jgi:hypothetical protein
VDVSAKVFQRVRGESEGNAGEPDGIIRKLFQQLAGAPADHINQQPSTTAAAATTETTVVVVAAASGKVADRRSNKVWDATLKGS